MSTSEEQNKKTIKLVVSPQYHPFGYRDYTAVHDLSDTPSVLKTEGSSPSRHGEMTLLFRGRKITPEEENISFENLMRKFCVSMDEEVLVFHCIISQLPASINATPSTKPPSEAIATEQNGSSPSVTQSTSSQQQYGPLPPRIQVNESMESLTTTSSPSVSHVASNMTNLSVQPPPTQSLRISSQTLAAAQQLTQQTTTQSSSNSPVRINAHIVPIQYQAVLVNGIPLLAQLSRSTQVRLASDMVIPVLTHEGRQAFMVSPAGVMSLIQQGYPIVPAQNQVLQQAQHTFQQAQQALQQAQQIPQQTQQALQQAQRAFQQAQLMLHQTQQTLQQAQHALQQAQQTLQQAQQQQPQNAQPQAPPRERRFGLTDLVSLFRRRLSQQLWLMCKLAFMVGIFSSNNASWRRIVGLCIAAACIFFWQTGELERWARRFRRPVAPVPPGAIRNGPPAAPPAGEQAQQVLGDRAYEGPMAAVIAGLKLAEQILFVFVASLWPNAVGGRDGILPEDLDARRRRRNRENNIIDDESDDEGPDGE